MSDEALEELKKCFLEAYDDNNDGKIDIREVDDDLSSNGQLEITFKLSLKFNSS